MQVKDIIEKLNLQVVTSSNNLDAQIENGFVGDLLSVVMSKAPRNSAWITIQSHINIVAVATLIEAACIIVTEGFEVEADAIEKANEEGIIILTTKLSSYQVASELSKLGLA